jgi:hypothetical protein
VTGIICRKISGRTPSTTRPVDRTYRREIVAHRTLYFTPTLCLAQTVRACSRAACPNGLIDTLNPRSVQRASGQLWHVRVCLCGLRRWSTCDTRQKALAAEIARHPPSVQRAGTARFGAGPRTARPKPRHRAGSRRGYQRCGMVLHGVLVRDIRRERAVSPPTASRALGQSKRASKNDLKRILNSMGGSAVILFRMCAYSN